MEERKLKYEDLGSSCCGAPIYDPGNTGEGLCSDCKEHCSHAYAQEVSVMVLRTNGEVHHHIFTNNWSEDDLDEQVQHMVDDLYNVNECRFMYSTENVLTFTDHTN